MFKSGEAVLIGLLLCPLGVYAQQASSPPLGGLTIRLEQYRNEKVVPVRPEHVFTADDVVRFRLKSANDGYIYVVDHSTSGEYTVLFPAGDSSASNAVQRDTEFYVPTPETGWFQVGGAPGFDTVYFLLSPTRLTVSGAPTTVQPRMKPQDKLPDNLLPRCNDSIFKARGECVDDTAGPAVLPRGATLPPQISVAAADASRDLSLVNDADGTVRVTKTSGGPAVYVFRIAHK